MSSPDVGDVHVNRLLSDISVAFANEESSYVADRVFPLVYAQKQSDQYATFGQGAFFADEGDRMLRAPGAPVQVTGYTVSNSPYFALNYAIGAEIPVELRANADDVFQLDQEATQLVTELQRIRRERSFATDFMTTGVWGTDVQGDVTAGYNKWSDYGASNPLANIRTGIRTVQTNIGRRANKLVMGRIVWDQLVDHPDLVGRISGGATNGQPAMVRRELLAQLLELDEVVVADAVYNSAAEGLAVSMTRIIDDDALLLYTPTRPGRMTPSAGYTFVWQSAALGSNAPQYIRRIEDDKQRRTLVEAWAYWDQVRIAQAGGFFFQDISD